MILYDIVLSSLAFHVQRPQVDALAASGSEHKYDTPKYEAYHAARPPGGFGGRGGEREASGA